ncbi:oligopeptide transporter subunit; ATP-binding component of ABC superfamily [uncultured Sporomusa sp.]|uniref:Nickel import system ATP-binding protein NikD n=1 Tax=uncultured Sporomusa sp. TaxID=307249 RepID=A0A212M0S1_9FIRM|nr:ABC transporter ATP-binding protein [uncultured Sporomusa sp.]SCM83249.1 oligopeptide transporter subunit; ATP-binding component of ABC superfamily [uncultured Sporomusa sp.]
MSGSCSTAHAAMVAPAGEFVLEVAQLRTEFCTVSGSLRAVNDISFSLAAGEVLVLAGESGSGKSVTALSILNLIAAPGKIAAGKIMLGKQNICNLPESSMEKIRGKQIGMIFQNPLSALNPLMRIGSQFVETLMVHNPIAKKEARQQSTEWLRRLALNEPGRIMASYPSQLSIGMCQRVMIAMALALQPQLLIADEPTSALEVTLHAKIIKEIELLRQECSAAVLFITHDLNLAAALDGSLAVMYAGSIVEYGNVRKICEQPRHPYTEGLLQSRIIPGNPEVAFIHGMPPLLCNLPANQCAFAPRCRYREDICQRQKPILRRLAAGQAVACHLAC